MARACLLEQTRCRPPFGREHWPPSAPLAPLGLHLWQIRHEPGGLEDQRAFATHHIRRLGPGAVLALVAVHRGDSRLIADLLDAAE